MQHVVVTGAGGFVGGFLAHWLAAQGYTVTAIVRHPVPDAGGGAVAWRVADLAAPDCLPARFDTLIHCAAEIPARCSDPDVLYDRNFGPSRNIFLSAKAAGAHSIVFLSSMSAFGNIAATVVTEALPPDHPDPYGRAKLDAEKFLENLVLEGFASGLSIRLPGTVGGGSHHNFLSDAAERVIQGQTVVAKNPAAPFNNIVYVGDLARFIEKWLTAPRLGYAMTMLAAEKPISLAAVVEVLFACAGRSPQVRFEEGGKAPFLISLEQAKTLGYEPPTVEESVRAMMRDKLKAI